jgi:MerR family transcriptional regulator, light-induced transcriptional regulator
MDAKPTGLGIKAVSRLTGVNEFTLRAWEKRYGFPAPERSKTGRRLYNLSDVEKIRLLSALTERGHSISEIADFDHKKLGRLMEISGHTSNNAEIGFVTDRPATWYVDQLFSCISELDLLRFDSLLKSAQHRFDSRSFALDIALPLLGSIGSATETEKLDVYHEHASTSVLRTCLSGILYGVLQTTTHVTDPPLIFAAPEGDHHDFGILIAAILAVLSGFKVLYLGPNMPLTSLLRASSSVRSQLLVVSLSAPEPSLSTSAAREYFSELTNSVGDKVSVWIGGPRLKKGDRIVKTLRRNDKFIPERVGCFLGYERLSHSSISSAPLA